MKVRRKSIHAYVGAPFMTATLLALAVSGLERGCCVCQDVLADAGSVHRACGTGHPPRSADSGHRIRADRLAGRARRADAVREGRLHARPVDGRYGPLTERAVMALQAACGLTVDGIVGPRTLAELRARASCCIPRAGYPMGSPVVRGLQRLLAKAGSSPGPIDGLYGPLTEAAVTRYQTDHGLQADGIAGARTLADLRLGYERVVQPAGDRPAGSAKAQRQGTAEPSGSTAPTGHPAAVRQATRRDRAVRQATRRDHAVREATGRYCAGSATHPGHRRRRYHLCGSCCSRCSQPDWRSAQCGTRAIAGGARRRRHATRARRRSTRTSLQSPPTAAPHRTAAPSRRHRPPPQPELPATAERELPDDRRSRQLRHADRRGRSSSRSPLGRRSLPPRCRPPRGTAAPDSTVKSGVIPPRRSTSACCSRSAGPVRRRGRLPPRRQGRPCGGSLQPRRAARGAG